MPKNSGEWADMCTGAARWVMEEVEKGMGVGMGPGVTNKMSAMGEKGPAGYLVRELYSTLSRSSCLIKKKTEYCYFPINNK